MCTLFLTIIVNLFVYGGWYSVRGQTENDQLNVQLFDLTNPTQLDDINGYYEHVRSHSHWIICFFCGFPKLGTTIHYQYYGNNPPKPADISVEYLLTRLVPNKLVIAGENNLQFVSRDCLTYNGTWTLLQAENLIKGSLMVVIDVSSLVKRNSNLVLTLDDAYRWIPKERDFYRPTLLLFKFGWTEHPEYNQETKCLCMIPGISYDLAAFIAVNLGHVVGVGTDTPSLESEETRQTPSKTVSGLLGKSGVYIIENVDMTQKIPEKGCLAMVMPLKLHHENYVPTRMIAICPPLHRAGVEILLAQADTRFPPQNISTL